MTVTDQSATRGLPDHDRPFFAYGIFMPGEIAFFQIKHFVQQVQPSSVPGAMLIRDGVPVLNRAIIEGTTPGYQVLFRHSCAKAAYDAIEAMEPSVQYKWVVVDDMNVLAAIKPGNGARPLYDEPWSSWRDPAFGPALEVVEESLAQEFDWNDLKPFYRLQAGYMLLWSCIERYVSLRYGLSKDQVTEKVKRLGSEPQFIDSFRKIKPESALKLRPVASSGKPRDKTSFDANGDAGKVLDYLYQVRSNVTHRGKEQPLDWDLLATATRSTLDAFRLAVAAAEAESRWSLDATD